MYKLDKQSISLVNDLISGIKRKEVKKYKFIYSLLKILNFVLALGAFVYFGVSISFASIICVLGISLVIFKNAILRPAIKALELENLAKQDLMLEIQCRLTGNGIVIDGRTFKLERTATLDSRSEVYFNETSITDDGEVIVENKPFSKTGDVEEYIKGFDDKNGFICFLKIVRESLIEQKMLVEGNGYVSRTIVRENINMLDDSDMKSIPVEIVNEANNSRIDKKIRRKVK